MNRHAWISGLLLFLFCRFSGAEEVNIIVDDYPPYIDLKAENKGFMTALVVKAFKEVGMDVNLSTGPWKRIESIEIDEQKQLSFAWIWNKERGKRWYFSEALMSAPTILIARKDRHIQWESYRKLDAYVIGLSRGYSYGDEFDALIPELNIQTANSDLLNIKKLLMGRIDIFPVDPYVGAMLIRQHFSPEERNQLTLISEPPFTEPYPMHAVCAKSFDRCPYYLIKFNEGLNALKRSGEMDRIIDQALSLQ